MQHNPQFRHLNLHLSCTASMQHLSLLAIVSEPSLAYMFASSISPDLHPCSTILSSDICISIFPKLHPCSTSVSLPLFLHLVLHTCLCLSFPQTCIHAAPSSVHLICITIFPTLHPCSTTAPLQLFLHLVMHTCLCLPFPQTSIHAALSLIQTFVSPSFLNCINAAPQPPCHCFCT